MFNMRAPGEHYLRLVRVHRRIGQIEVLRDLTLTVDRGEFLTLLGPSGSGKTTTLNLVAGFDVATDGAIHIANRDVTHDPPHTRGVGMVFQSYALFPHLTIEENVAFPLQVRQRNRTDIKGQVERALSLVRISGLNGRYPAEISGGQAQRVAIARAIVFEPKLLLMDEPLGALDRQLRTEMQFEIQALHRQLGITVLYVTHDQEEALSMSTRIAVLNEGRIEQCAVPRTIYDMPANRFVAGFVGEMNFLNATVVRSSGNLAAQCPSLSIEVPLESSDQWSIGQKVCVAIRPEHISLEAATDSSHPTAQLEQAQYLGDAVKCRLRLGDDTLTAKVPSRTSEFLFSAGANLRARAEPENFRVYPM